MHKFGKYGLVVKAVVFKFDEVLVLKRSGYQKGNAFEYDLPGGRLEKGEDPNIAIHREIFEETGIVARVIKPIDVFYWYAKDEKMNKVSITYVAEYVSGEIKKSFEHEKIEWINTNKIPEHLTEWVKKTIKKAQ